MITKIEALLNLANQLPTGLYDPQALQKMEREREELEEAALTGDRLGTIMEAGDCVYYAAKAYFNGMLGEVKLYDIVGDWAMLVELPLDVLLDCAIAKFALRAVPGNSKDDAAEREAVRAVVILHFFGPEVLKLFYNGQIFQTVAE